MGNINKPNARSVEIEQDFESAEWIVTMREELRLVDAHPEDVLHVPYAELCANPEKVCRQIAEFVDLPPDPVFMDYAEATLSPPKPKTEFPLPKELETPFRDTCAALASAERS